MTVLLDLVVLVSLRVSITWEACNRSKPNGGDSRRKKKVFKGVKAYITKEK